MMGWIAGLAGNYTRQLVTLGTTQLQFLITAFLFALPMKKRRNCAPRLAGCFLLWLALLWAAAVLRTHFPSMLTRLPVTILNIALGLPMLFICLDEDVFTVLTTWCASVAAEEIGATSYDFLMSAFGVDTSQSISFFGWENMDLDMLIFFAIHVLIYLAAYLILGRRRMQTDDRRSMKHMTLLVLASVALISVLSSLSSEYRAESSMLFIVSRVYGITFAFLILLLRAGIISQGQARSEILMMEQVMAEERKQYEHNQESINLINMRCHDLKHQLANLAGRLTDEEVKSLQEAMNIYDSTIKTGNEVLDVVLYENQLTCQKEQIQLSCLANGKALSFMRTRHIYALFDNAVSNAIEAVRRLSDPEMKVISLNVGCKNGVVEIVVTNYFAGSVEFNDGLPSTTKENKNQHGFGSMSIRYIAEQYRGTMKAEAENGIYTLTVRLPVPAAA